MVKKFILLILLVLFSYSICFAQYEYVYFTNDPIKVAWDAVYNAVGYDWQIRRINESIDVIHGSGSATTITFKLPSAGIYVLYCNAWNYKPDGITPQYSDWATSLNAGTVGGKTQPWVIVIKLKSVGPLMFD